ncbi:MAG: UbiA family prenyltransferase [Sulfuricella sp.]|nr:UbiA family prenyltransferase [Sulfuricella sp.]
MNTLVALIAMARPVVCLLGGIGAAAGLLVIAPDRPLPFLLQIALIQALVWGGGFTINDYFDVEKDRLNEPWRAIPSGRVSRKQALGSAILLFLAGNVWTWLLEPGLVLFALQQSLLLAAYSRILRWNGIAANVLTAYLSASAIAWGAVHTGNSAGLMPAFVFIFLLVWSREIVFDIHDRHGDASVGIRSFATLWPEDKAFRLSWLLLGLLLAVEGAIWAGFHLLHPIAFIGSISTAVLATALGLARYQTTRSKANYLRFANLGRLSFLLALPGLYLNLPLI